MERFGVCTFLHYFSPLVWCSLTRMHMCKFLSCLFPLLLFFHLQWPHPSQLKCECYFLRAIPKSTSVSLVSFCSTLGISTVTLSFSACTYLLLRKSVFRWNCITPVANSGFRLKSCILRSWDSGFALKSLLGHSEKRNWLKDRKHTQKWVDAWWSPGSVFFKCCCAFSESKKKPPKLYQVRGTKFLWVQYMPYSGN